MGYKLQSDWISIEIITISHEMICWLINNYCKCFRLCVDKHLTDVIFKNEIKQSVSDYFDPIYIYL